MASSPGATGPCSTVPSIRPLAVPPAGLPAKPTVVEPCGPVAPEEFAVPAPLVPGVLFIALPLPAPLGSFPELFKPAAFAGPVTPLIAELPAPAEPAAGADPALVPPAAPLLADAPLAEP